MFNLAAWYKKQMANPELDTATYLRYHNELRDMEFRQNILNAEAEAREKKRQQSAH